MSERFSLKDHLFNKKSVTYFADLFYTRDNSFPRNSFIKNILNQFPQLELKERIYCICRELELTLPHDYHKALNIVLRALPKELDPTKTDDDFGEYILAPFAEYVARNGRKKDYLQESLDALREMTKRFSAENAIRYFINAFPKETLRFLKEGAQNENYHVRRLSSEGTRPRLPWCIGITLNYIESLPILNILFQDTTRYVTRSVANHMNDISKIDPVLVISTLKKWRDSGKQNEKEMNFILQHSLRTLIKQGNTQALALLGYTPRPNVIISNTVIHTPTLQIGETLEFSFTLESLSRQNVMIDYIIHHQTKSGLSRPKIFKIKKISLKKGATITINKRQAFRIMTTKKLYPGKHILELQINGKKYPMGNFHLVEAS